MKGKRGIALMWKRLLLAVMLATVLVLPVLADVTTESKCDVTALGTTEGSVNLEAIWNPKSFSCEPGTYLNADAGECTACPYGAYCSGVEDIAYDGENHGIAECETGWTSDENASAESQCYQIGKVVCSEYNPYMYGHGTAVYANIEASCRTYYGTTECEIKNETACDIVELQCDVGYRQDTVDGVLQCVPADIKCGAGTYLPKNSSTCAPCTGDAYCPGGTYHVPNIVDQGIVACEAGLKAPVGARSENDCGRILHVGDAILHMHKDKRSEHSLVVKVDGINYYADTTPISEGIKTINPTSTETLRVKIDGVEYSVHETIYE